MLGRFCRKVLMSFHPYIPEQGRREEESGALGGGGAGSLKVEGCWGLAPNEPFLVKKLQGLRSFSLGPSQKIRRNWLALLWFMGTAPICNFSEPQSDLSPSQRGTSLVWRPGPPC